MFSGHCILYKNMICNFVWNQLLFNLMKWNRPHVTKISYEETLNYISIITFLGCPHKRVLHWTANKFNSWKYIDSTGQKHSKTLDLHSTAFASIRCCCVPHIKIPTPCLIMNVVKKTMLGHQESIALKGTG